MNITEKAKAYAEGNSLSAITKVIQEAYAVGYKDGYNDGLSSRDNLSSNDIEDGVEYADLGLPSGTKWATDYLRDEKGKVKNLLYEEARDLNLPTPKQFREFIEYTRSTGYTDSPGNKSIIITGANGNRIKWKQLSSKCLYSFWLKNLIEQGSVRDAAISSKIENWFIGYRLPIILVR